MADRHRVGQRRIHFLTGREGSPPSPYYDPLKFWIDQAHARGIELHAWFNPYRARPGGNYPHAPNHVAQSHPELVVKYGDMEWLDPGQPEGLALTLAVFTDVVTRYDIVKGNDDPEHPSRRTTLKGGAGYFYQPPQFQETNAVFGTPGLNSNKPVHYSVGVEQEFTRQIEVSLEGYYKNLTSLDGLPGLTLPDD